MSLNRLAVKEKSERGIEQSDDSVVFAAFSHEQCPTVATNTKPNEFEISFMNDSQLSEQPDQSNRRRIHVQCTYTYIYISRGLQAIDHGLHTQVFVLQRGIHVKITVFFIPQKQPMYTLMVNKKFMLRFKRTVILWCESSHSITAFPSSETKQFNRPVLSVHIW